MSQPLHHEATQVKFKINCKLQVAVIIPPTLSPTEAWGGVGLLVTRGGLERSYF